MNVTIKERRALPTLMHWREEVLENVFGQKPSQELLVANRRYYMRHIDDGSHIAVVAQADGMDAGCGGMCLTEELPSPDNPSGRCAYLMNIYVREPFRRRGIARSIVEWLVAKARELECDKIYLETTPQAYPLYKEIGFEDLPGIMKYADIHDRKA